MWSAMTASPATLEKVYRLSHHTYADGPTSGQFKFKTLPNFISQNAQPVISISDITLSGEQNILYLLTDNGYGKKEISADFIPRLYRISAPSKQMKAPYSAAYTGQYIQFRDEDHLLNFAIQADFDHYYRNASFPKVPEIIKSKRILTGADFDPESIVMDNTGNFWIGDEFGPFIMHADSSGKILHAPFPLPEEIASPDTPLAISTASVQARRSGGFEAMAISPDKNTLWVILEKSLQHDDPMYLRLYKFDIQRQLFASQFMKYPLNAKDNAVSAMAMVNANQLLVLEDNLKLQPKVKPFQALCLVDLNKHASQVLQKTCVADLLVLNNPQKLLTHMPHAKKIPIDESLQILDSQHVMLANDNNGWGDTFIKVIALDKSLDFKAGSFINQHPNWQHDPSPVNASSFNNQQIFPRPFFKDNDVIGWVITLTYFMIACQCYLLLNQQTRKPAEVQLWQCLTLIMLFLCINKQMDVQTIFINALREFTNEQENLVYRLWIKVISSAVLLSLAVWLIACKYQSIQLLFKKASILMTGLSLLLIFSLLRFASFAHFDVLLPHHKQFTHFHHHLELIALLLIYMGVLRFKNKPA